LIGIALLNRVLLTPAQVAKQLQVEERTITQWLRGQRLRGFKIGKEWRIAEKELESFLESRATFQASSEKPD
jgi:excisionase family DNA binding protein